MLRLTSKFMVDLLWSACVEDTDLRSRERERNRERERERETNRGSDHINPQIHPILTSRPSGSSIPKTRSLYVPWTDQPLSPNVITESIWTTPAVTNLEISDLIGWGRSPRTSTRSVYTKVLGRPDGSSRRFQRQKKNSWGNGQQQRNDNRNLSFNMFQKVELPDTFGYGMIHMWNTLSGSRLLFFSTFCQGNSGDDQVAGIWGCYAKSQVSTKTL